MLCSQQKARVFPGGSAVKNFAASAGGMGSVPDLRGSHMLWSNWACEPQLLNLLPAAQEPQLLKPKRPRAQALQLKKPLQWEACALQQEREEPLLATTKESPRSNEDSAPPKINKQNYVKKGTSSWSSG